MTYVVTYSRAHCQNREIGEFPELADALDAAEAAGAVIENRSGIIDIRKDRCFDVLGHENDDDYAIWIERRR